MMRRALNSMLYFPERRLQATPADVDLDYDDLEIETEDGERLHGWLVEATAPSRGHVLLCHGNAGNVGDRVLHAALLAKSGFDVLLFDYRGYGRSTGSPSEEGTYRDARAARTLLDEPAIYLGESLGGAVALKLARESPPAGLVLQSTFTSVRDMARSHYPFIPSALVPDAYPSNRLIGGLEAPLLVLHGERDDIVPVSQGRALFDAAPEPKQIRTFPNLGHNDLVPLAGEACADTIAAWAHG
jgi:fermentation-respiration switch protein FrsA (DUF1100 family)